MNDEQDRFVLLDEIAAAAVPTTVDLCPTISQRVDAGRSHSKTAFGRARLWRVGMAAAALLLSLAVIRPVRESIADTIQHFGIVATNDTVILYGQSAPGTTAVSSPLPFFSLAEAQQRVNFVIPMPGWIPPGMHLRGAFVGSDDFVALSYVPDGWTPDGVQSGFGLEITPGTTASFGRYAIPSSAIQHVTVNGSPAVYAHGAWDSQPSAITWHGDADDAMLSWSADGFVYTVSGGGPGIGRDDLFRIAESVHAR